MGKELLRWIEVRVVNSPEGDGVVGTLADTPANLGKIPPLDVPSIVRVQIDLEADPSEVVRMLGGVIGWYQTTREDFLAYIANKTGGETRVIAD